MTTIGSLSSFINKNILPKMDDDASLVPLGIKDSMDNMGRVAMEYNRGGKDSHLAGQERFREEWATTAVWIGMRKALEKALLNPLMKWSGFDPDVDIKLLLKQVNPHQVVPEALRLHKSAYLSWTLAKFVIGTVIPVAIIGMGIPRWNQALTRKAKAKEEAEAQVQAAKSLPVPALPSSSKFMTTSGFRPSAVNTGWYTPNPWTYPAPTPMVTPGQPFRFGALQEALLSKAATFVTDGFWGNVAIDLGISGGRIINARNPIDRMEYAGREASIILFMYWAGTAVKNVIRGKMDAKHNISTHLNYDTLSWLKEKSQVLTQETWTKDMGLIAQMKKVLAQKNVKTEDWRELYNTIAKDLNGKTGEFKNLALAMAHKQGALQTTLLKEGRHVLDNRKLLDMQAVVDAAELMKPSAFKNMARFLADSRHYKHWAMAAGYLVSSACTAILTPWVLHQITKWRTGSADFPGTMKLNA